MHPMTPPPVKKKTPVWVWILAGVGGTLVLLMLLMVGAGFYALNLATKMAQNPAKLGEMLAAANPDLEMIDSDSEKKTIRVRDKKSGETVTIQLDDLLKGRIKVEHQGQDGTETLEVGGKLTLPNWMPKFPDVEPVSLGTAQSDKEGEGGIFQFTAKMSREKIEAFYRDGLQRRGLAVKTTTPALIMHSDDDKLHATITIEERDGEQRVTVAYGEKR